MQTWMKVAAAVGILVVAGVVYWLRSEGGTNSIGSATEYQTRVMCRACGQDYPAAIHATDHFPLTCEKCGKKEAWPQMQCYKCGYRFVPEPVGNPPHMPVAPRCPKCGSESVGGVLPDK
jgi:ribosomal protein L37E